FLQARFNEAAAPASRPVARIESNCLARQNVACDLCRDACERSAIRFAPRIPIAVPRIATDLCTGCTDCLPVCPVGALVIQPAAPAVS
ncbi:MAG TPA: 4Fe-4S dicluster domain-containing protein, partial [Nitrospiraceae bacterium]|nr:4Fe-4S dicluster domain-containing protein [Nitrospiraceae bacterium]